MDAGRLAIICTTIVLVALTAFGVPSCERNSKRFIDLESDCVKAGHSPNDCRMLRG